MGTGPPPSRGRATCSRSGWTPSPHGPLPDGVLNQVSLPAERARLGELAAAAPGVCWDRVLFSAKESVYKAWFPLARRWLGFDEADVTIDPADGTFRARLLVEGPVVGGRRSPASAAAGWPATGWC